ncbi:T9SS type A sorting domain-containing protein [Paenimyroides ceti]
MKKNYILLVLFLMILQTKAQSLYVLATHNAAYSDLVNPISINNGEAWNGIPYGPFEVPFSFKIANQPITNFGFENDYFVFFTAMEINASQYILSAPGIYVLDKNYETGISESPLSYKVDGIVGNRILKIEIKNAGSETELLVNQTNNLFLNVQIWIYEGTDVIEYHYGNSNITQTDIEDFKEEEDPLLVAIGEPSFTYSGFVSGNPVSPTFNEINNGNINEIDLTEYALNSYPASGTVYRFTPSTTVANDKFDKTRFSVYPNPATEVLNISLEKMDAMAYIITDMTGKTIQKGIFKALENTIELGNLSSGMYCIRIGDSTQKFIKK